jgi:hypothetical protein
MGEVDSMDLCSNFGCIVEGVGRVGQQITKLGVPFQALIIVRDLGQGRPTDVWKLWPKILMFIVVMILNSRPAWLVVKFRGLDNERLLLMDNSLRRRSKDGLFK